jgi:hypothetical protein
LKRRSRHQLNTPCPCRCEQRFNEIEEEAVDQAKQVPNEGGLKTHLLTLLARDADADDALPSGQTLTEDVVAEPEE